LKDDDDDDDKNCETLQNELHNMYTALNIIRVTTSRMLRWMRHLAGVHKSSPLIPVRNQTYPAHNFSPYYSKILSNIILQSTNRCSKWPLPCRSSDQNSVYIFHTSRACYM